MQAEEITFRVKKYSGPGNRWVVECVFFGMVIVIADRLAWKEADSLCRRLNKG